MTREMNKPDWHNNWANRPDRWCICTCDGCNECKPRVLDDWIKPFVDSVNERFKQCGKQ